MSQCPSCGGDCGYGKKRHCQQAIPHELTPRTRTEADKTITRLQGEAGVMRELLRLAHGVIETIEPDDYYESEKLMALMNEIQALLKARAM